MLGRQNQHSSSEESLLEKADSSSPSQSQPSLPLFLRIWHYKTPFDRSKYSCLENALRGTTRSFLIGYSIKTLVSIFKLIQTWKGGNKQKRILEALFNVESLKIGSFLGVFTAIMKLLIPLLRIIRKKDDGFNGFVATFIGAYFSLFFLPKNSRAFFGLFLLARAFDCCYNHMVNSGKLKKRGWHYVLLFALINMFTVYNWTSEPYLIPPSIEKFYTQVLNPTDNDILMRHFCTEVARRDLKAKGVIQDLCHSI